MKRAYYSDTIAAFLGTDATHILGVLTQSHAFCLEITEREAWLEQTRILQRALASHHNGGMIYLEYTIPRLGKRIDAVLIIGAVIFVLEFKVGESEFPSHAIDQVWDYALDLKNFHEPSHGQLIVPILVATEAKADVSDTVPAPAADRLTAPVLCNSETLSFAIQTALCGQASESIVTESWEKGRYCPTPTIVEAASVLYAGHGVEEISRSDASAVNLSKTSASISSIIDWSRMHRQKAICFVTGVPGAGKTLVGLDIANKHSDPKAELYSVFLSGNGPLVAILREALARDKIRREQARGEKIAKGTVMREVKLRIQNVHNFRDDCLVDNQRPPIEHVAVFDEAQRAWDRSQTSSFMVRKKGRPHFDQSEPEYLISCMDRHHDWAVIVCLVGGGQEINIGEAGISEWIDSLVRMFPAWHIFISPRLTDSEYASGTALDRLRSRQNVSYRSELHLGVSMRAFRSENVSLFVKQLLDMQADASGVLHKVLHRYPMAITRDFQKAKQWLKEHARGSERYGVVASSQAQRLKPHAIDVRSPMDPIHWFLAGKVDVRSSYYLEEVATEFHVQGLELDWTCVAWDADFRFSPGGWEHWSFRGDRWTRINKPDRQMYLKNAYRVLLTRARQGMVIVVPQGESADPTRSAEFYDSTFAYLSGLGIPRL